MSERINLALTNPKTATEDQDILHPGSKLRVVRVCMPLRHLTESEASRLIRKTPSSLHSWSGEDQANGQTGPPTGVRYSSAVRTRPRAINMTKSTDTSPFSRRAMSERPDFGGYPRSAVAGQGERCLTRD